MNASLVTAIFVTTIWLISRDCLFRVISVTTFIQLNVLLFMLWLHSLFRHFHFLLNLDFRCILENRSLLKWWAIADIGVIIRIYFLGLIFLTLDTFLKLLSFILLIQSIVRTRPHIFEERISNCLIDIFLLLMDFITDLFNRVHRF